jgi:predicted small lipoprotein YifL
MKDKLMLLTVLCALALLAGCGAPGAPLPPSLELARAPLDLTATRKGNSVTLTWTPPTQTTDGTNIRAKYAGPTLVCRSISEVPLATCIHPVGKVPPFVPAPPAKGEKKPPAPPKAEYVDTLPADLQQQNPTAFAEYAVSVENTRRRSAGLSNQVRVPLAPTLPPPAKLSAKVTAEGILLSWPLSAPPPRIAGLTFAPRIYRRDEATKTIIALAAGPVYPKSVSGSSAAARVEEVTDRTITWEKNYTYWVTMVTTVTLKNRTLGEVEGDDSPPVTVTARDVFPPAIPEGLQAVASGVGQKPFIDLTWVPGPESDLAGYNVFRQDPAGHWTRINAGLVPTPSFRDENVVSGHSYTYSVSAVDERANESARSQPASETVP